MKPAVRVDSRCPSSPRVGGIANFTTTCWAPAYCAACRTLVIANYLAKRPCCPTCKGKVVFYDDSSLRAPEDAADHGDADAGIVFSWFTEAGEFRLRVGRYLCPACGEFGLEFHDTGLMWD